MLRVSKFIILAIMALLYGTAVQAACTAPSGVYVGVGSGVHYICSTTPSNGKCLSGYVDDVVTFNVYASFSSTSTGTMKWRMKKLGLGAVDLTFTLPKISTTTSTSPSTSSTPYHYFNSTLCRGYLAMSGTLDSGSSGISGSIGAQLTYVSTNSGAVVAMTYDSSDTWTSASYTIQLERP